MGCPISIELADRYTDRIERVVMVPDYVRFGPVNTLRLFREMTQFPALERLLEVPVPTLAVLGSRDPCSRIGIA